VTLPCHLAAHRVERREGKEEREGKGRKRTPFALEEGGKGKRKGRRGAKKRCRRSAVIGDQMLEKGKEKRKKEQDGKREGEGGGLARTLLFSIRSRPEEER